jgi:hypothetical protein
MNGPNKLEPIQPCAMQDSSLLGPFISCGENKVLLILPLGVIFKTLHFRLKFLMGLSLTLVTSFFETSKLWACIIYALEGLECQG